MNPSERRALTGPNKRSAFVAQTSLVSPVSFGMLLRDAVPSPPLPRIPTKGVPTLRASPPRFLVTGEELMSVPYSSTPPATCAARPPGTSKYDRAPERPITRRKCISDSTEEVGPLGGIRGTNPCQILNLLWGNDLGR